MRKIPIAVKSGALSALLIIQAIIASGGERIDRITKRPDPDMIRHGRIEAMKLVNNGEFEKAISLLKRLHEKAPEYHAFTELLADTYLRARKPEKAADLLEKELVTFPGRTKYVMILGKSYLDIGMTAKAVETWHGILRQDSSRPPDFLAIAQIEWEAGLFETAIETLRNGKKGGRYFQQVQLRLIKYETLIGDHDAAFRDGLLLLDSMEDPTAGSLSFLLESFSNSNRKEACISSVDSLSSVSINNNRFFRITKGLLLFELSRYAEAEKVFIELELTGKELYAVISNMNGKQGSSGARRSVESLVNDFLKRNPDSPVVPKILLSKAESRIESIADSGNALDSEKDEIVELLDKVILNRHAAQYKDRAKLLKAGFLVDEMRMPREALSALRGAGAASAEDIREKTRIEVFSLLGCKDPIAKERFEELSSHPDSAIAALGRFASAELFFLDGEFEKALNGFSKLAEGYPSSEWANDALDMAILIKKALNRYGESLTRYSTAVEMESGGEFNGALSVLDSVIIDFPGSPVITKAVFLKARILERYVGRGDAGKVLLKFSEEYPLDDHAPEALEKLAMLVDADFPDSSAAILGEILERYPDYAFIARIREKYISANKSKKETAIRPEGGR